MKILSLNTYKGQGSDKLCRYIKDELPDMDVFCFQEAAEQLYESLTAMMPDFKGTRVTKQGGSGEFFENAMFIRNDIPIVAEYYDFTSTGLSMAITVKDGQSEIMFCNVHGHPRPGNKKDNPERMAFSHEIISFTSGYDGPKVIVGDFNMLRDNQSIKMFEESGFANLIDHYNIERTRPRLATVLARENHALDGEFYGEHKYADYAFISGDIAVEQFIVPNDEGNTELIYGSDHFPLILQIATKA